MTEAEWQACNDPQPMLACFWYRLVQADSVGSHEVPPPFTASDRKLRLFAVACCRSVWPLVIDSRNRNAVEVAERFADGEATKQEMRVVHTDLVGVPGGNSTIAWSLAEVGLTLQTTLRWWLPRPEAPPPAVAAALLREIFGNPFRPVMFGQDWAWANGAVVRNIATIAYQTNEWSSLPVLADALEDAGCTNRDILDHCRQPGVHVRGCWVVDLILGKE